MEIKRKVGRPPSDNPSIRRASWRWTDDEWAELHKRAAEANMNLTQYVKHRTIGGRH